MACTRCRDNAAFFSEEREKRERSFAAAYRTESITVLAAVAGGAAGAMIAGLLGYVVGMFLSGSLGAIVGMMLPKVDAAAAVASTVVADERG